MTRRILIPSEVRDENQSAGKHFGRAKWYLIFDETCTLVATIPGAPETHHGLVFKLLHKNGFDVEAALVTGTGTHAMKIMEKWGVKPMFLSNSLSALDGARAYFEGELSPLKEEAVHACRGHVH